MVENNDDNVMRNGNDDDDDNKQEQSANQALAVEEKEREINECQKLNHRSWIRSTSFKVIFLF